MSHDPTIARRDLLRAGTALVGGAAFGLFPALASAADRTRPGSSTPIGDPSVADASTLSIGYWNGGRFVSADTLAPVASELGRARLTLTSLGNGGIQGLEAYAPVTGVGQIPYILWVARPAGLERTRAYVLPDANGDIVLTAQVAGTKSDLRFSAGKSNGAKLRAGTYILTTGKTDWSGLSIDAKGRLASSRTLSTSHVLITIESA